jgi:hypothetical protein
MWPQVALTHHAKLSKRIEPHPVYLVNLVILAKDFLWFRGNRRIQLLFVENGHLRLTSLHATRYLPRFVRSSH